MEEKLEVEKIQVINGTWHAFAGRWIGDLGAPKELSRDKVRQSYAGEIERFLQDCRERRRYVVSSESFHV